MKAPIADSGFFIALLDREDPAHVWAKDSLAQFRPPLLTCESALCEAAFFLGAPAAVARLLESGTIDAGFDAVAEASRLTGLLEKYPQMDWTDACIVRLSELHRQCEVLTVDERHFRVYRRFGRETIPLHLPPTSGK